MTGDLGRPDVAPLWKRWLAARIDELLFAVVNLPFIIRRRRKGSARRRKGSDLALTLLSGAYHVSTTANLGQTVGQMAMGIRVVDRKTAASPNWRQSLLRWSLASLPGGLLVLLPVSAKEEQARAAMEELRPAVEELRERHPGNRQGLNEALIALYRDHNVRPSAGCFRPLLRALSALFSNCILYGPALRGPLHQGLHDWASNTVVVEGGSTLVPGVPAESAVHYLPERFRVR